MDGQDGQHVEVRWAELGPRGKVWVGAAATGAAPTSTREVFVHAVCRAPVGHVLSFCCRAKIGR